MNSLTISNTVRTYPRLPYEKIKNDILGKNYQLSLAFVGEEKARSVNQQTRRKGYVPNVLSFPLTKTAGEIIITPSVAKKEAPDFGLSYKGYVGYLFIHGLLHLRGLDHGKKMDVLEKKFVKLFKLN